MSQRQCCTKPENPTESWNCSASLSDAVVRQGSRCKNVPGLNVCAAFSRQDAAHRFNRIESHFGKRNVD